MAASVDSAQPQVAQASTQVGHAAKTTRVSELATRRPLNFICNSSFLAAAQFTGQHMHANERRIVTPKERETINVSATAADERATPRRYTATARADVD